MEQEPGPRGSPQLPHASEGIAVADEADEEPLAWTANTDIREASFLPWHFGQLAFSFPITKASKEWWQSLQVYSNRGIVVSPIVMSASNSSLPGYTVLTRFHASLPNATFSLTDLSFPKLL